MIFSRLIAFPESRRILKMHLVATPFLAIQWSLVAMIPVLLRDHFQAGAWQTAVSTAAIPVLQVLSIFWNALYARMRPRHYLSMLWIVAIAPVAGISLCHHPNTTLLFVVISSAGFGAMTPLSGDVLRSCYPPAARSKIFSVLQICAQLTIMVSAYGLGCWLELDHDAFRIYLPVGAVLIGAGMLLLGRILRQPLFVERHKASVAEPLWPSVRNASRNMIAVFARDRNFRRYEAAFFIYGMGWMVCAALLPFLVVDKLDLNYEQVARSTQTALQLAMLLMMVPTGYLMDRYGPIRTAGWSFAMLTFYPVGLMLATGTNSLTLVTLVYAIGLSGVNLAWTIGPITLAQKASDAPHYLAIHATLVGLRAVLGQFPAVALYMITRDIRVPLVLSVVMFAAGAVLMLRLERHRRAGVQVAEPPLPIPPPHTQVR